MGHLKALSLGVVGQGQQVASEASEPPAAVLPPGDKRQEGQEEETLQKNTMYLQLLGLIFAIKAATYTTQITDHSKFNNSMEEMGGSQIIICSSSPQER